MFLYSVGVLLYLVFSIYSFLFKIWTVFCKLETEKFETNGPFLERRGNLKSYFEIKVSRKVGCVLTSNEVQFVSLANNFAV